MKIKKYAMLNTNANTKSFKERKYEKGQLEKLKNHLNTQIEIAKKIGVRGTPSVFDANGNKVVWVNMLNKYGVEIK